MKRYQGRWLVLGGYSAADPSSGRDPAQLYMANPGAACLSCVPGHKSSEGKSVSFGPALC